MKNNAYDRLSQPVYVIQEHNASHLHWDLRLEKDGILKSWALPKEPPQEPKVKRLAVEVPDHPLGYENFEGEIPEGQYGAGSVKIWDSGHYKIEEETKNKLVIDIFGKKLHGKYNLIKFADKPGKPTKNWLFFKS